MGECQSEDPFVCFGTKPTQRAGTRDLPWDQKKTKEGRSQSQQKWAEQGSRQERAVNRSRGKPTARMCGPGCQVGHRERMNQHSGWLCGNFTQIHALDSSQNARKMSQTSPLLRLEWTQVRVCSLIFHPLGCVCYVFCVCKVMWNTLGQRWEKPLDNLMAMSGLGVCDSGDWPAVYCHIGLRSPSHECPYHETKQSDGEIPVML